ncbi:hypothetical protein GCM10011274_17120 [Paraglaciecola chathamensis]|uniref:Uncharacterized protein n=1 Tax=Paraglaciecola chathamensis TaxID=368405 RepID=A0A8H9M403_9ALTE|nr:hypothetical protein GCM10011274_17120 [Paraglaciecola oceanifecundans]
MKRYGYCKSSAKQSAVKQSAVKQSAVKQSAVKQSAVKQSKTKLSYANKYMGVLSNRYALNFLLTALNSRGGRAQ